MTPYLLPEVQAYNRLMADSFYRYVGRPILPGLDDSALSHALYQAAPAIVSHGTEADPVFRYANAAALSLWEMDWPAFTRLLSRHSAEARPGLQADRDKALKSVLETGFFEPYSGIRISSTGRRFEIRDTALWNVTDQDGRLHGQAALIGSWHHL